MTLEERYTPAGDTYWALADRYGEAAADSVYQAALANDPDRLNNILSNLRRRTTDADYQGSTSFWANLGSQLVTDPLAAPLDAANTALKNTAVSFLRNPMVLLAIGLVIFFALGGARLFKRP